MVSGQQAARDVPIPVVECGALWCSCDFAMPQGDIPERCPGCARSTAELLSEAEYNAKVLAWLESLPLDAELPGLGESGLSWWQRTTAAYEARGA